jgi:ribosome-associated protein
MKTPQTETAAKKDVLKLQRAIVDGLEDVKAQDIQVFNTEQLSPLFERVIIASGTSNRQTKALASSVRDAVREAGFDKPRMEGEENGEWIIVDCGPAVAHIMQPAIRQYYHLEDLWGETPVRLKLGAAKPVPAAAEDKTSKAAATAKPARKKASKAGTDEPSAVAPTKPRRASRAAAGSAAAQEVPAATKRAAPRKRAGATSEAVGTEKPTVRKATTRKAVSSGSRSASDAPQKTAAKKTTVRVTKVKPLVGAASAARKAATSAAKPAPASRKRTPAKRAS